MTPYQRTLVLVEIIVLLAALLVVNALVWLGFGADTRDNQSWDPAGWVRRRSADLDVQAEPAGVSFAKTSRSPDKAQSEPDQPATPAQYARTVRSGGRSVGATSTV
jgi:hypothetical protein